MAEEALHVHITGVVQGVGFRPFVYNLASELGLVGWVLNSSAGVEIEAIGEPATLALFKRRLESDAPPLARIEQVTTAEISPAAVECPSPGEFAIRHSEARPGDFQPISPDICICDDCLRELFDPEDRRYRYPFINCTNCGPRFTIIQDIPYDRPLTTMAPFEMCAACQAEYEDPGDRRFHAQPNACPVCGPQIWFQTTTHEVLPRAQSSDEALLLARRSLQQGAVLAVKGLGGFHLACDATNDAAVRTLRRRKGRVDKPFALMSFDVEAVEQYCRLSDAERALLTSRERPIVLLQKRSDSVIAPAVAPGNKRLGVMLPYTPLHYVLLEPEAPAAGDGKGPTMPLALVMTSANYSEEPIVTGNEEALRRLSSLADGFLLHDRAIHARCDDSVTQVFAGVELPIRRSRGYAPYPIRLPFSLPQVLAVGAELKNTFCLTRERYAFLSQHIGDMENYETIEFFRQMVEQLARMFRVDFDVVACDLHPGYLTTRHAQRMVRELRQEGERDVRLLQVQHHRAHVAACMAENGLPEDASVIGVIFDGTGFGPDRAIWGGEFLCGGYREVHRAAHLAYVPLPGGDAAIRHPYRSALAYLWAAGIPWKKDLAPVQAAPEDQRALLIQQLQHEVRVVPTSSVGRLFDAVSSLLDVRHDVSYEAQAAIELEMAVDPDEETAYAFGIRENDQEVVIDPVPVIEAVVSDLRFALPISMIAARFHNAIAEMIRDVCVGIRCQNGVSDVVLSGGVFQNTTLLARALPRLVEAGFTVHTHRLVPPNDACIALGQAVIAGFWAMDRAEHAAME